MTGKVYPVEEYRINVRTVSGFVNILIDPTEFDRPSPVRIGSGADEPEKLLRRYMDRAYGMRGGGVSLEHDSPVNIIGALIAAQSDPSSWITGYEVVDGLVPDESWRKGNPEYLDPVGGPDEDEDLVAESAYVKTLAEKTGLGLEEAERRWDKAKKITEEQTELTEDDGDEFWAYVTGVFKKSMGITESAWTPWVGFDLDGTLAVAGGDEIGPPVPSMLDLLRQHLEDGDAVKIFTARAADPEQVPKVRAWLESHGLDLEITNEKDPGMIKLYDDRAVPVERDLGVMESALGGYNFRSDLARADDLDDISEVFRKLFGAPPSHNSPYFKDTFSSVTIKLSDLVARETPDPERLKTAHARMRAAKDGAFEKRKPIYVFQMGNGKYKVLDGNTTLHALLELGETEAVVEIKRSLKQQVSDQNSIDAVYEQAAKAQPLFKEWAEAYAGKTGGKLMLRPGLKGKKRAGEKVANDYGGVAARLTDVVGGMIIFDTVEQVAAAYRMIVADPAVYKAKNRFQTPTSDGYMDVLFAVNVGGHLCELQLNTEAILTAKEKGLGHKIYEVKRQIDPIAKDTEKNGDLAYMAMGYSEELRKLSVKYYRNAAMSDSSSSASSIASDSEISETLDRILAKLSGSVISTHFSIDLPSIRNSLPQDRSMAKGTSSFSPNLKLSDSDISPPLLDASDLSRAGKKVNGKVLLGRPTRSYLSDDRMLFLQYAIVEAKDLVTSHTEDMGLSEEFPQELQPRDRTRDAMVLQVERIANKLNPDRMGGSLQASTGSPIVGPDLIVESGNGRTIALNKRYARDEAPDYRAWLKVNAKKFGFGDLEGFERPVLVRIRLNKDISRVDVAEKSNSPDMGTMSPAELALMDARRLPDAALDALRPSEDGDFLNMGNKAFMDKFVALLGASEVSGLTTKSGQPTKQLADRAKAAVFQRAYGDANLLALVAEEANPDLKNVLAALTIGAKEFAKLKIVPEAKDLAQELIEALVAGVNLVRRSRAGAQPIEETIGQSRLFETVPEDAKHVARYIDANVRRQARMGAVFGRMAKTLRQYFLDQRQGKVTPEQLSTPTIQGLLDQAVKESEPQKGLFESAGDWKGKILAAKSVEDIEKVFDAVGVGDKPESHMGGAINKIRAVIDPGEFDVYAFGLRVVPKGHEVEEGDFLDPSYRWEDGEKTDEELDGTSAIGLPSLANDAIARALLDLHNPPEHHYIGDQVVVIKGDSAGWGEDPGEQIISDAEVVAVFKKTDLFPIQSISPKQDDSEILESAAPSVKFKTKKFKLQGRYQFQGMPISVENKAGSVRKGTDQDGHEWKTKMRFDYGYIRRTIGADDEGIDVYVGPDRNAKHVYIVKQHDIGKVKAWDSEICPKCGEHVSDCACPEFFDEDKVMLGFSNRQAAIEAYLKQYDSPLFLGPVSTMTVEDFRDLVTGNEEKVKIPLQFVAESAWIGIYRKMIGG